MSPIDASRIPCHLWLRYCLSSLFGLVTIAGLFLGWLANERGKSSKQLRAISELEKLGGTIYYDDKAPRREGWMRTLLGDNVAARTTTANLSYVAGTEHALDFLKELPQIKTLILPGKGINDAALSHLGNLTRIEVLMMFDTSVTGVGFAQLSDLAHLRELVTIHGI